MLQKSVAKPAIKKLKEKFEIKFNTSSAVVKDETDDVTSSVTTTVAMTTVANRITATSDVSKASASSAEDSAKETYARCNFGRFGYLYFKENGTNLFRSGSIYLGREETGSLVFNLFRSHLNEHYNCRQNVDE